MDHWASWAHRAHWAAHWTQVSVADEAEDFLRGHALEALRAQPGDRVPAWRWLDALVHGSLFTVQRAALGDDDAARFTQSPWVAERARLARELIAMSGGDESAMRELQRRALVPLELRLAALAPLTPIGLVDLAVHELHLANR